MSFNEILTRPSEDIRIGTATTDARPGETVDVDLDAGDNADDFDGWWCVSTDPWPCPNAGCDFVALHLTAAHLIIVWPEKDHPHLLDLADRAMKLGNRNCKVVEYEKSMGAPISYYELQARGFPIHGTRWRG